MSLAGGGFEGLGEDVTYDAAEHDPERRAQVELAGPWTLDSLSQHLEAQDLFPAGAPAQAAYRDYRRWAFESAALDLALRQAGLSLGGRGRARRRGRSGSSPRPGRPRSRAGSTSTPSCASSSTRRPTWTDELVGELAAGGNVDVVDLKGAYHGTVGRQSARAGALPPGRRGLPAAPGSRIRPSPRRRAPCSPRIVDRVTWDAPIHSWADVEALPHPPRCLNSKPSRFGSVGRLFEFYDRCAEHGIALYGGGQFELGVGRGQIQLLAGIFHPDGPNDVAPGGYNAAAPLAGLPVSPLDPSPTATGFRRAELTHRREPALDPIAPAQGVRHLRTVPTSCQSE